jgi:hypothetical protein
VWGGAGETVRRKLLHECDVHHVKDKLENRLHKLVCAGRIALRSAQRRIAADWEALYKSVYGVAPA